MVAASVFLVLASGMMLAACGRGKTPTPTRTPNPTPAPTATSARTPTPTPTPTPVVTPSAKPSPTPVATPTSAPTSTPALTQEEAELAEIRAYLEVVFPPGPGRDDLFLKCTNCHGIHMIIMTGVNKNRDEWEATRNRHDVSGGKWAQQWSGRQADQDLLYEYVVEHLGADKPPLPPMPERLNQGWAVY